MVIPFFLLLTAVAFTQTANRDTSFVVDVNGHENELVWQHNSNSRRILKIDRAAAIYGQKGIQIIRDLSKSAEGYLTQSTLFIKESWQRFYFCIDSIIPGQDSLYKNHLIFLQYMVSEKLGPQQPDNIVFFTIVNNAPEKTNLLTISSIGISKKEPLVCANFPLTTGKPYCVESRLTFFSTDSVELVFWIDGIEIGNCRIAYHFPKEEFRVTVSNQGWMDFCKWYLSFDEFVFSDKRIMGLPKPPTNIAINISGNSAWIKFPPFRSTYLNESAVSIQSTLFRHDESDFPIYNSVDPVSVYLNDYLIPALLDSGNFLYRVRYLNNFGKWSDWTNRVIHIDSARTVNVKIEQVVITEAGFKTVTNEITPGKWYDINLHIDAKIAWKDIAYTLIWLNDTSYTFGHALNKGGRFFKESSYILNLSMLDHNYLLFEKERENSGRSICLPPETTGKYLDGTKNGFAVDTISGHIRLRFRLLEQSNKGAWSVSTVVAYRNKKEEIPNKKEKTTDNFSNIYRFKIYVNDKENDKPYSIILLLSFSGIALALLIYRQKRSLKGQSELTMPIINAKLLDYIDNNLSEKLSAEKAYKDLKMRKHLFYKMLRDSGITSFPNFVNARRIEKAKALLKDQTKNITEIGYLVGFENTAYFIKLFKDIEKCTPKEYQLAQNRY